jgi:hypothetical protein
VFGIEGPAIILSTKATKQLALAGQWALGIDSSDKKQLQSLAKSKPAMDDAADSYAKIVAVKQAVILRLFKPLAKWAGVAHLYFDDGFPADMAARVAGIPEENLTTPKVSIAAPAIQGLSYSLDEPNLKDMYLNLLATASDNRRGDDAHPSFAEVIKQLSAEEAALLKLALTLQVVAIVRVKHTDISSGQGGWTTLQNHITDLRDSETMERVEHPIAAVYVDNWIRLGLVEVSYDEFLTTPGSYDWVDERPELSRVREDFESETIKVSTDNGILRATNFGKKFAATVGIA